MVLCSLLTSGDSSVMDPGDKFATVHGQNRPSSDPEMSSAQSEPMDIAPQQLASRDTFAEMPTVGSYSAQNYQSQQMDAADKIRYSQPNLSTVQLLLHCVSKRDPDIIDCNFKMD